MLTKEQRLRRATIAVVAPLHNEEPAETFEERAPRRLSIGAAMMAMTRRLWRSKSILDHRDDAGMVDRPCRRRRSLDKRRKAAIPVDVHNLAHAMPMMRVPSPSDSNG